MTTNIPSNGMRNLFSSNFVRGGFLLAIITFSYFALFASPILAHDVIEGPWMLIDGKDLLIYNNSIEESQFEVAERTVKSPFALNSSHSFKINTEAFAHQQKIPASSVTAEWRMDEKLLSQKTELKLTFRDSGNKVLHVKVFNDLTDKEIFADTVLLPVNTQPKTTNVQATLADETKQELSLKNSSLKINKDFNIKLAAPANPNLTYNWDIGGMNVLKGENIGVNLAEANYPDFILLRTTDNAKQTYRDLPIKISYTAGKPQREVVNPPMTNLLESDVSANAVKKSGASMQPILLSAGVIFAALLGIGLVVRTNRKVS